MRTNDLNFNPLLQTTKKKLETPEIYKYLNIRHYDQKIRFSICKYWGLRNSMYWYSACARQWFSLGDEVTNITSSYSSTFGLVPVACLLFICFFSLFPYSPSASTVDFLSKIYLKFIFFLVSAASILSLKTSIYSFEQDGCLLVSFCLLCLSHRNSRSPGHTEWPFKNMTLVSSLCCPNPSVVHPLLIGVIPHRSPWPRRPPRCSVLQLCFGPALSSVQNDFLTWLYLAAPFVPLKF